jgi:tripartite-type tricarboxylate transporter receptor subunit TctC
MAFLRILAVTICLLPSLTFAQTRLVKVIVPYAPGGNVDVIARLYARKVGEILKENWIIENKSGASGTIGADFVARAAPDGTTLLFVPDAHSMVKLVVKNVPYDPVGDFTYIARVASAPLIFVVNPVQVHANNLSELVAEIKANPTKYSFAISGLGTSPHMGAETFRSRSNTDVLVVPSRGTGPAISDVVAGQVNMMVVAPLAATPMIKSGRLKALAVTSAKRFEGTPDIPTTEEAGMPGFVFLNSYGFLGPKNMSKEVVSRLSVALKQASESADLHQQLFKLGISATWEGPETFARHAAEDLATYGPILQNAGVKPQ